MAATITLTGPTACGFSRTNGLFLIAAAKPPSNSAASEAIPQISTNWRYIDPVSCLPFCIWNDLTVNVVAFLVLLGRVHYEIRGIHPKTVVCPWCNGDWNCISSGETDHWTKSKFNTDLKVYSKHLLYALGLSYHCIIFLFVCFPASGDNIYLLSLSEFGRRSLLIPEFYSLKKGTWILNCFYILILKLFRQLYYRLQMCSHAITLALQSYVAAGQQWFSLTTGFT